MNGFNAARIAVLALCLGLPPFLAGSWADAAGERLRAQQRAEKSSEDEGKQVAVASAADKKYCNAGLKKILRRVLRSCGLLESGAGTQRGCEPADAESVAEMSGSDFNALFKPMKERGGIVQFDQESAELDRGAKKLLGELFADRRGASYFLVVARASTEGAADYNRKLSKKRANAVMSYLQRRFDRTEIKDRVGLLWLGEEYAQLEEQFCGWRRSRSGECSQRQLNRSAFIAWIDCTL